MVLRYFTKRNWQLKRSALLALAFVIAPARADEAPLPMKQGTYQVRVERDAMIKMRDGVRLATDLYFPEGKGPGHSGGLGAILLRTPYDKSRYRPEASGRVASMFASHGFAVAIQDVRGKYQSEGDFGVSKQDATDGYDTVDWLSKQSWSNNKVAMFGCSYDGEAQILTAPLKHPALVALIPRGAGGAVGKAGGRYRYFGAWNGGAVELGQSAQWFPVHGGRTARDVKVDVARVTKKLPTIDLMSAAGAPQASTLWKEFVSREMDSPAFDQVGYLNDAHTISSAALHVNSWFDYGVADTLFTFNYFREHATNERAAQGQYLIISPTSHCGSEFAGAPYRLGELELGDPRIDLWSLYVNWFKYWLYGEEGALRGVPKVQYYLMGKNVWRTANAWPVPGTTFEKFYLGSKSRANSRDGDGRLTKQSPHSSATDRFVYDPATPVPTLGGQSAVAGSGAVDQRAVEQRKDVLVYTGETLTDALDVVGPLSANFHVSSSAPDTDFTVKLVDVFPDGTALNVQEGILRMRYREGMDKKVWMRPQGVYPITISLQATAYSFAKGHRIRVEVSSSNFPRFDRNLNTGGNNFNETEWQTASNSVHHSPEYPSHIVLPILRQP